MKKSLYITVVILFFNCALFAQSGWVRQNSGTSFHLYDVQFINENTGYVAGSNSDTTQGVFLKTTNSGSQWVSIGIPASVMSIYFVNENTGFASSRKNTFVLRTTNGGVNWEQQNIPQGFSTPNKGNDVWFTSSNSGYIVTENALYTTTNSGNNWEAVNILPNPYFQYLYFINAATGFAMGVESAKTTNAGVNWTRVYTLGFTRAMTHIVDSHYFALSYNSCAYMLSTDGGFTWGEDPFFMPGADDDTTLNSAIGFGPTSVLTVAGNGGIFKSTTDLVNSWVRQPSGVSSTLHKVAFVNSNTGWIAGANGVILKTTTGGTVGFTQISTVIPEKFSLKQNYPNPFNPSTKISFAVPKNSFVILDVFDINGKKIESLVNKRITAGEYDYSFDASGLSAGVYFYQLQTESFLETKKMILIK